MKLAFRTTLGRGERREHCPSVPLAVPTPTSVGSPQQARSVYKLGPLFPVRLKYTSLSQREATLPSASLKHNTAAARTGSTSEPAQEQEAYPCTAFLEPLKDLCQKSSSAKGSVALAPVGFQLPLTQLRRLLQPTSEHLGLLQVLASSNYFFLWDGGMDREGVSIPKEQAGRHGVYQSSPYRMLDLPQLCPFKCVCDQGREVIFCHKFTVS